jgi:hypothetical protein
MITKDKTWELLNAYLDGDFRVLPMAPNKSSEQDISYIENKLEIKFPEEYKIHLLGANDEILGTRGIYVEALESVWQRPKALDVGPFWSFLYGLHTYTASKESEDWMRLEVVGNEFISDTGLKAVPILKIIGDADVYCIDDKSNICIYRHEENIIESVNWGFWEVLEYELKELKGRKERKIQDTKH